MSDPLELAPIPQLPPAWISRIAQALRNAVGRLHQLLTPPPVAIMEGLTGPILSKSLAVAVELEIAEHLRAGPLEISALAEKCDALPETLARVLRTLCCLGFFRERRDGRFSNNSSSRYLLADHPQSLRNFVLFFGSPWIWRLFQHLPESTRTGASGASIALGKNFFQYVESHPELRDSFQRAMAASAGLNAAMLATQFDFKACFRICDMGGGTGTSLRAILSHNAHLMGVLYDLPGVIELAEKEMDKSELGVRMALCAGNFFESAPEGCDLYLFQAVLHDWNDEECVQILRTLRHRAPTSRVLVVESLIPEGRGYDFSKLVDVWVLLATGGGRERTLRECDDLFRRAGYRTKNSFSLPTLFTVMELEPGTECNQG